MSRDPTSEMLSCRETRYIYGSSNVPDDQSCLDDPNTLCNGTGIDLLEVRQVNPCSAQGYDELRSYTYNDRHQVQTVTVFSEAGQPGLTTTHTYTANGQVGTVTTPGPSGPDLVATYGYDADGRLESIATPTGELTTAAGRFVAAVWSVKGNGPRTTSPRL